VTLLNNLLDPKENYIVVFSSTGFIGFAFTMKLEEPRYKNIHCLYRNEEKKYRLTNGIGMHLLHFIKSVILLP
jgi:hypothetical protein